MSETNYIFQVGFDKNGDADFGVNGAFYYIPPESMEKIRAMIIVAIGTMESMYRQAQERKHQTAKNDNNEGRKD